MLAAYEEVNERIQSLPDDDWIAVTDRLPETKFQRVTIAYLLGPGHYRITGGELIDAGKNVFCLTEYRGIGMSPVYVSPTHWQPLPPPPLPLPPH